MQLFILSIIVFSLRLKISFAAATSFTQVTVDHHVIEFELGHGDTYNRWLGLVSGFYPGESLNVVYSENERVTCFLRGYTRDGKTIVSPNARYMSPVSLKPIEARNFNKLICYDISDDPNTAILLLGQSSDRFLGKSGSLHKLQLDENKEGVILSHDYDGGITSAVMIESPYKDLWCKMGDQYLRKNILGYRGKKIIDREPIAAIPCTTKPLPVKNVNQGRSYGPKRPDYLVMDNYFEELIKAERNKATMTTVKEPLIDTAYENRPSPIEDEFDPQALNRSQQANWQ